MNWPFPSRPQPRGVGGVLPHASHIKECAVPKGMVFVPFWSGIGQFLGSYRSVWIYLLFQFQMNRKRKSIKRFQHGF